VTIAAVVGLSLIAEHLSTRLAGVLAGFPHGIAIVLYFIGKEQGADFAAAAAGYATAGLGANVVLAFTYARLSARFGAGWRAVLGAGCGAVVAFLLVALALALIAPGPLGAMATTLILVAIVRLLLRSMPPVENAPRPRPRAGELLGRAALAAGIVVLITGLATVIGPDWAGLLAGFPVVTFPLLVILHARHGPDPVGAVVRHYPFGILSLVVFTVTVRLAYADLDMGLGTLLGLAASLAYLSAASFLQSWRRSG